MYIAFFGVAAATAAAGGNCMQLKTITSINTNESTFFTAFSFLNCDFIFDKISPV
jgi:hypothetical protein